MKKEGLCQNDKRWLDDNFITHKLEEAFGYSDEQLAAELDQAAAFYAQHPDPNLNPPEDEFQKIMERVERESKAEKKVLRLKKVLRPMLVAALLGGVILGSGIGVNGLEGVEYGARERSEGDAVFNNAEAVDRKNDVEQAYNEIVNEFGIPVVEFFYTPKGMVYQYVILEKDRAIIDFVYKENYFHFYQMRWNLDNSINYKSDRKTYKTVYNRYLDCNITVYKNDLDEGEAEFGAQFSNGDAIYYLYGIIDEDEFIKIVEHLKYYEN